VHKTFSCRLLLLELVAISLLINFGCNRTIDSTDPVRTLPDAPPTPINVSARLDNQSVTLLWEVLDTSSVRRFRIYLTDSSGEHARLRDSTPGAGFSRTLSGLALNQTVYFTVATVGREGIEGLRSFPPLRVRMSPLSIVIENGRTFTNRREVTVQANAPSGATNIKLSENADLSGAVFQPFSREQSFTLSAGDAVKHVYAQFVFDDGAQTGSPVSDDITLDTRARIDTVYFRPSGTVFTTGSAIDFRVRTGESGGTAHIAFPGEDGITLYDDGSGIDSMADDGVYAGRYIVPLAMAVTDGQVTGSFTDAAGNQAPSQPAFSTLSIAPTASAVQFTLVDAISSSEVSLNWSVSSSSDFSAYRLYRARSRTVTSDSTLIGTVSSASSATLVDTSLRENTWYFYRVYVFNQAGRSAASAVDSARTLVNADPVPVVLAGNSDSTGARLTWSENGDPDFAMYRLYRASDTTRATDTTSQLVAIFNSRSTTSFDDAVLLSYPALAYRIYVFDRQGKATPSNKVVVIR